MTDLLKQRMAENKEAPYMSQHELVFEIIELEKQVISLQKGLEALLSSDKPVPVPPVESKDSTEKE